MRDEPITGPSEGEAEAIRTNVTFGSLQTMRVLASGVGAVAPGVRELADACVEADAVMSPLPDGRPVLQVADVTPWFGAALADAGARVTLCCGVHRLSLPGATPDEIVSYAPVIAAARALASDGIGGDRAHPAPIDEAALEEMSEDEVAFVNGNTSFGKLRVVEVLASARCCVRPGATETIEACEGAMRIVAPFPDGKPVLDVADVSPTFAAALSLAGARVTLCCGVHSLSLPVATPEDIKRHAPLVAAARAMMATGREARR